MVLFGEICLQQLTEKESEKMFIRFAGSMKNSKTPLYFITAVPDCFNRKCLFVGPNLATVPFCCEYHKEQDKNKHYFSLITNLKICIEHIINKL